MEREKNINKLIFEGEYLNNIKWKGNIYDIYGNIICKLNNENNKILREYNEYGNLLFEGEHLNGKRNGKGKEYYKNGKLLFEGEYLNGKKWQGRGYDENNNIAYDIKEGKGLIIEYDFKGNLKFEGEYLNGERNGKGKEYYSYGKLKFEGEYLKGERNGKGKEYYDDGKLEFEGEYLYGYRLKGKEYINEKLKFEADCFYDHKYNVKGYDEYGNIIYELKNDRGNVIEYDDCGKLKFEGEYLIGKRKYLE